MQQSIKKQLLYFLTNNGKEVSDIAYGILITNVYEPTRAIFILDSEFDLTSFDAIEATITDDTIYSGYINFSDNSWLEVENNRFVYRIMPSPNDILNMLITAAHTSHSENGNLHYIGKPTEVGLNAISKFKTILLNFYLELNNRKKDSL